jgi:hypothetical protein
MGVNVSVWVAVSVGGMSVCVAVDTSVGVKEMDTAVCGVRQPASSSADMIHVVIDPERENLGMD